MHGHGFAPPQPRRTPTALLVVVRVLFVALALLSFGFLAWGTMLRIAVMRRRRSDWLLFWVSLVAAVTCLVVIGEFSAQGETAAAEEPRPVDFVCMFVLLGLALGVPTHYLVADIRHYQDPYRSAGWPPPLPTGSPYGPTVPAGGPYGPPGQRPPGYGYPPVPPAARVPSPTDPLTAPAAPAAPAPTTPPAAPAPPAHAPTPAPAPAPAPATLRIDQVRAELDELSDLLRKEEGK